MTIAAGFKCKDGVVLCSDTQITQAAGKSYESKIYRINPQADCFLVYAGDVAFIKEFVAELKEIIANKDGREIVKAAKGHYRRFHDKFYTHAPKTEKAFAQIILTVRDGETILLFAGNGRHFYPVENYVCFGIGSPVAEPFFGSSDFTELPTLHAAQLAIYTLWKIKDYAEGVGGKTKVLIVSDEVIFAPPSDYEFTDENVKEVEEDYQHLEEQLRPLILNFPSLSSKQVARLCRSIGSDLRKYLAVMSKKRLH